ncbi:RNA polymerase sigma factor [Paenibacillus rigui]|uniref:RNA polymerase subunit sigma n=1 Tax=Paenibacillus rigui TaxID=554312 RepID=A0A229UQ87_9BACL|nr:RNA polymerase sigma factor [Paenibacillus rigui]OXM85717.1 RNA polymerase subunit sigma [Paenibacillus rigui]
MTERELFEMYRKDIYRTCYYMLRRAADAEDVCQEVFITVFRHDWRKVEFLKTWLIKIAMNHCINHLRKENRFIHKVNMWNRMVRFTGREEKLTEVIVEEKETVVEWRELMQQLPVKIRAAISLRYLNECSLSEIAAILDIPVGTVKSRINKGLKLMKSLIGTHVQERRGKDEASGEAKANDYSVVQR